MHGHMKTPILIVAVVAASSLFVQGCERDRERNRGSRAVAGKGAGKVVVYTSVDEQFAEVVLERFEERSEIELSILTDSEAGKTTGLVQKIEAEASRPRADVFWSSELFGTILLARKGLLEPYDSPAAADIPDRYKDPQHRWTACAVRGRVVAFDLNRIAADDIPRKWEDLADPRFASGLAYANPLFGTTRGHVAAMFALWGPERGRRFLTNLRDNGALMVDGNSSALRMVMTGGAKLCATDTDDVWLGRIKGAPLDMVYPDMGDGGTLLIPCSVALVKGGPNVAGARKVVDFLVSAEVERMLAKSFSHNIPVREALRQEMGMDWPSETTVPFDKIADAMDESVAAVREILIR